MEAYLDNSATTFVTPDVMKVVTDVMTTTYGNPSSKHMKGVEAERILRDAREKIAATMKVDEKEIFFTSGATESNNWAIRGAAMANKRAGNHIITTAVEHASVLMPVHYLEENGFRVTYLKPDKFGRVSLEDLKNAICDDTILVSMMQVNNEVGAIEPIEEAGKLIKSIRESIIFHVDAVQSYGKLLIRPKRAKIDMLSVSGHKLHAPKGSGFLYIKEKTKVAPFILGGGQQKGMRSGTDNVPGAAGLAKAAEDCYANLAEHTEHLLSLKAQLMDGFRAMENVTLHSLDGAEGAPHIVSASFVGVRSEVLLHALEDRGIYVSAASACSSNKNLPVSAVLVEMDLPQEEAESTLRFSLSRYTTAEEIDYALKVLNELVPQLRKYTRF